MEKRNGISTPLAAILVFSAVLGILTGSNVSAALVGIEPEKPVLSYLLRNADLLEEMGGDLALSRVEREGIERVVEDEASRIRDLHASSDAIARRSELSIEQRRELIRSSGYNSAVGDAVKYAREQIRSLLGEQGYDRFSAYINEKWDQERALHSVPYVQAGQRSVSYTVFTTQYFAETDYEAAIPDQYIKFANRGWEHQPGYSGSDYRIDLEHDGHVAREVIVWDVGPWNIDDNYWNAADHPERPRRMFADLPTGMPEAQAAYFDGYHGGLDQYGREVTLPTACDLTPDVAADIGLAYLENDWITVTFTWESAVGTLFALDASYSAGTLTLDYTLRTPEPATWANYLILTSPSVQVIPLWTISLPVIDPAIDVPVAFPLPSVGMIGIYSGLFTAGGAQAVELAWVDTTGSAEDCAAFVADLTYPDGTAVSPGETISKGWRMSNCGDTTWSAGGGFRAVRISGSYGPTSFSIPTVGPGATGDLYASITVPTSSGTHRATYQLEGPRGTFGDRFWVEITVQSTTTTVTVDDGDSGFVKYGPSEYWHREWIGYGGDMYWTYVNGTVVSNYVRWNPQLPGSGNYKVKVFIPHDHATTTSAKYKVRANGSTYTATVNQSIYYDQWVTLGTYYFSDSGSEYVELSDATGESGSTYRKIGFDAVRWERQ